VKPRYQHLFKITYKGLGAYSPQLYVDELEDGM